MTRPSKESVRKFVGQIHKTQHLLSDSSKDSQVKDAVQVAVEIATAEGLRVTDVMRSRAAERARCLGTDAHSMERQARRSLLADAAIDAATLEAERDGYQISRMKANQLCAAAVASGSVNFQEMLQRTLDALGRDQERAFVVAVTGYKQMGLDLAVFVTTLGGESFQVTAKRGASVARVAEEIRELRWTLESNVRVKLIGPAGTLLEPSKVLQQAFDYETDVLGEDDDAAVFYPRHVLQGADDRAAWRKLGLHGPTRWKLLREKEFAELFGISKASFEQLPSWKQNPLKKKHNLF